MKKTWWSKKITEQMQAAGTHRDYFDGVVKALSEILEERDETYAAYVKGGRQQVVEKTSDRGAVNMVKNPLLVIWMELNRDALSYWKELGLTSKGFKELMGDSALKAKSKNSLEELLEKIG